MVKIFKKKLAIIEFLISILKIVKYGINEEDGGPKAMIINPKLNIFSLIKYKKIPEKIQIREIGIIFKKNK